MEPLRVQGNIVEKTSEKSGNKYTVLEVPLTKTYTATFFLTKEQLEILALLQNK